MQRHRATGTAWPWHTCRPAGGTRGWRWRARRGRLAESFGQHELIGSDRPRHGEPQMRPDRQSCFATAGRLAAFAASQNRDDHPIFDEVAAARGPHVRLPQRRERAVLRPGGDGRRRSARRLRQRRRSRRTCCRAKASTRTRRAILPARIACFATSSSRARCCALPTSPPPAASAARPYGMGVATGDYDNDGDQDLYVTALGPNTLYRNNGDGTFSDVTAAAGVSDDRWIRRQRSSTTIAMVTSTCSSSTTWTSR